MTRAREHLLGGPGLHEHPRVHDVHALAHAGDDAEVVRDQDQRRVVLGDEVAQEVEDLGLNRHVERRRRLVGDQELRLARKGHCDHRPLPHPARELVRIVPQPRLRVGDADAVEQLCSALLRIALVHAEVGFEHLADLAADRQNRVQARHRVLEDHRDLPPADAAELLVGKLQQVPVLEIRRSRGDLAGARQDSEQRERGHALAAARLADDPERLAGRDIERDAVDRIDRAAFGPELDLQVVDVEEGLSSHGRGTSGRGTLAMRRRSG